MLSFVLLVRNRESVVTSMVRTAVAVAREVAGDGSPAETRQPGEPGEPGDPGDPGDPPATAADSRSSGEVAATFEILAVDERSGDNTLSHLSILHRQIRELRVLQDVPTGHAIRRGVAQARGDVWVFVDRPADRSLLQWAVGMVRAGRVAATVPGEVLAVQGELGREALAGVRGGLVSAQRAVERVTRARGLRPAWSPAPNRGVASRAMLFVRRHISILDRPNKA